ncbi:hypothetical protein [Novosphingobium album (ex Hu et al. 2023)]|uniref:Uncharacterized protein n=1 Tax=Novosphingobium album (ex Hu et al. 2023) TaxID=2930093 RepID=A0ABT0B6F1_9SPHN|nr:hypothetical protein [Novosphingobium album (ex Hu et al. 2023)]MCJ2180602.1 hypothetical protein [Novosphingobium album (ex Hu et al. 2023)]
MDDEDPNIVVSDLSRIVSEKGITVDVSIFRLEDETEWTLEVINESGTSIVWTDLFDTEEEAFAAFQHVLEDEGIETFLDDNCGLTPHTIH